MNTSIRKKSYSFAPFLMAAGLAWAVSGELRAQVNGTWTNPAGGAWNDTGNWLGSTVAGMTTSPGAGSAGVASFNTINLSSDIALTTAGPRFIGHFVFGDLVPSNRSWSLSGDALTLNAVTPTITVNNLGTGAATISSILAGTTGLYKQGPGTVILSGANTYTGSTYVRGGQMVLDYASGGRLAAFDPLVIGHNGGGFNYSLMGGGVFVHKGGRVDLIMSKWGASA